MYGDSLSKLTFYKLEFRVPMIKEFTLCSNSLECKYPGNFTLKYATLNIHHTCFLHFGHVVINNVEHPNRHFNFLVCFNIAVVSFSRVQELHSWSLLREMTAYLLLLGQELVDVPITHVLYKLKFGAKFIHSRTFAFMIYLPIQLIYFVFEYEKHRIQPC